MNKTARFNKKLIASAIASTMLSGLGGYAVAQDDNLEEVMVTGIRASLEASADTKRNSAGVVDAINSEDMGKFPDTNLAESLQRITGVSISRVNGEGSEVTVRGFGGDNNMITLNGRMMPAANAYGGGSGSGGTRGGATRAFDFANLASESVSAVEVYKTSKANIATGGIGATVNIKTARPLDNGGFKASIGGKAVMDSTNRTGDDVTPELSGIVSWADDSDMFGVSLTASQQKRDFGNSNATVNDWNIGRWGTNNLYSFADDAEIINAPDEGQLYARPNDIRYAFSDSQRERTNAQLTLQFRPQENLTTTVDYTYAENNISEHRGEATIWFANGNSVDRLEFDNSPVASPIIISEKLSGKDHGFEQQYREQTNTLESTGLNVEWQVNDRFSLALDAHDSSMESLPTGPGKSGEIAFSMGAPVLASQVVNYSGDLPTYQIVVDDSVRGNNNGVLDKGDIGSQVARIFYAAQKTDITQVKIDGGFEFEDGRFEFGVESRSMETTQQASDRYMGLGDWGIASPGEIPADLIQDFNLAGEYDDYNTSASSQIGFKGDAIALTQWGVDKYGTSANGYALAYNPDFSQNNIVKEDTDAFYFQVAVKGELAGMETNYLTGFRYETTDVYSSSDSLLPRYLLWQDNNDFQTVRESTVTVLSGKTSYDHLLPSVDFDIALREDLKGRVSYSKTIARAGYGDLQASVSNYGTIGSTYLGSRPTANEGNPQLVPLESNNFDVSLEWYYDDSSYASVGLFEKRVANFVGTEQVDKNHFGVLDQTNGPRAQAAAEALIARDIPVDDTSLFVMMAVLDNPTAFPGGANDYVNSSQFQIDVATAYDLIPVAGDPEMVFRTSTPVNNKEAKIYGAEFAVQHFFGDTGFGVQANYTLVRGDIGFSDVTDPSVSQFALTGLSDTANIVAIYENDAFQARLAYNWRDKYLSATNRGNSKNPLYVEAYSQIDLNVSYNVNEQLTVFFEGLNLTEENIRQYGRSESQLWYLEDLGARYQIGARYNF
ncbi:TonB-dependent receptor [Cellvibrio sp. PSBB023]|uniref:TonB-dependent receptor n=1 Tax=Cellvibrio sp. PSBB023 TaxID=1945512 RepID=UPI00098F5444|nr:TonB-dependent receptor [Cellvibrio sp. PSBB023]AQT60997.1 TonB-dependent receptor [Cellvibrio sp. PSBB023]